MVGMGRKIHGILTLRSSASTASFTPFSMNLSSLLEMPFGMMSVGGVGGDVECVTVADGS